MNEFDNGNYLNGPLFNSLNEFGIKQNIMLNNPIIPTPEQLGMVRPKFNTFIEDDTQNSSESANVDFQNSVKENNPNLSKSYGFDAIAEEAVNRPREYVNSMKIEKLKDDTPVKTYESIGLPMDDLIREDPKVTPNYVPAEFDKLISNYTPNYDLKFGVQAIPVDMDRSMLPKPVAQEDLHINKDEKPNGRRVNNWFSRLIDQRGEEYITSGRLTIEEVSKNAERIIDDMISGRIDYDKYGKYIILPVIIETLINYCSNKLAINRALSFSLGYIYNDYVEKSNLIDDPERYAILISINDSLARDITQSIAIVNQDISIYTILFNRLSYVNYTKNVSNLYSLINELNVYKKQMKKRY